MTNEAVEEDRPTVVVCDDHRLMRESMVSLLEDVADVVGQAADGRESLAVIERLQPDIAWLDITMPPPDGLDVATTVHERWPEMKVVIVTMRDDDSTLRRATTVGVDAYLTKTSSSEEVTRAIAAVAEGGSWVSPQIASRLMTLSTRSHDDLTEREREVLEELAAGHRIAEIGERLYVSEKTVKNHLTSIYSKLGAETASQAVAIAYRTGLVSTVPHKG